MRTFFLSARFSASRFVTMLESCCTIRGVAVSMGSSSAAGASWGADRAVAQTARSGSSLAASIGAQQLAAEAQTARRAADFLGAEWPS